LELMTVSAGKVGFQVTLSPADLAKLTRATFAEITVEP
jgi:prolyl-tRNA editing enzyme YbaK/EbsC (Cys-tRNA(Pro) deacylase)